MANNKKRKPTRKLFIIPLVILLILATTGAGYYYWTQKTKTATPTTATTSYKTATVKRGTLTLSASGSGTLAASEETNLSFPIDGIVSEVNAKVGDKVTKGQVLAKLADLTSLQTALTTAELNLEAAKQELQDLLDDAPSAIGNAQLALAKAQKALIDAKAAVVDKGMQRCEQKMLDAYYATYMRSLDFLNSLGDGGGNMDYYLTTIVPAKNNVAKAKAAYDYCAGYTQYEIDSSHADLVLAEYNVKTAQATLDLLQKNNGVDPTKKEQAENKITNAQLTYDQAKKNLESATITAPFDGTILSVAGKVGDEVNAGTFITIADLVHPEIDFTVDETDIEKVAVGKKVQVVFDALPNQTFNGKVIQVNPALQSVNGYNVLQGTIQLDDISGTAGTQSFMVGLNASVEVISGSAENALLVPVEALRDLGNGEYGVFVVGQDGKMTLKTVTIGLQDSTYAEVKEGLSEGDVVSTGATEVK